MWKLYHRTDLADWPLCTLQLLCCPKRCPELPLHPHPCLHWPEALSPWHRLSGRSMNSPRPGTGIQSSLCPGAPVFMLNPPNLSEATEPLKPEASRHSTCSPHGCPLALAGPPLCVPGLWTHSLMGFLSASWSGPQLMPTDLGSLCWDWEAVPRKPY